MTFRFDARQGLIIVAAELQGPSGIAVLRLALDTGATSTLLNNSLLVATGYDPADSGDRVEITTGSGVEYVARVTVHKLTALGQQRLNFAALAHTLPPSAGVDGLLGLDFFRGSLVTIDFKDGTIEFT
jgi:predicted aspartyl protease